MTLIRSRRCRVIHVSSDLRKTLCNRSCSGWVLEPDTAADCLQCVRVARDIEERGN